MRLMANSNWGDKIRGTPFKTTILNFREHSELYLISPPWYFQVSSPLPCNFTICKGGGSFFLFRNWSQSYCWWHLKKRLGTRLVSDTNIAYFHRKLSCLSKAFACFLTTIQKNKSYRILSLQIFNINSWYPLFNFLISSLINYHNSNLY